MTIAIATVLTALLLGGDVGLGGRVLETRA